MNFLKNPYVKWSIIAFLIIVIIYDVLIFLKRGKATPPLPPEGEIRFEPVTYREEGQPLYELAKEVRDPFRGDGSKVWRLEEAIKVEQMELELLKTKLEKSKIERELFTMSGESEKIFKAVPTVKAVLWSDKKKTALLEFGGEEFSVGEGDKIGEYRVTRIDKKGVFLSVKGEENFYPVHPRF